MMKIIQKIQKLEDKARKKYEYANACLAKSRKAKEEANLSTFKAQRLREQVTV